MKRKEKYRVKRKVQKRKENYESEKKNMSAKRKIRQWKEKYGSETKRKEAKKLMQPSHQITVDLPRKGFGQDMRC